MKALIGVDIGSYGFDSANKSIYINNVPNFTLEQILLITNVTKNRILYSFETKLHGGVLRDNVLTLDVSTTDMGGDRLQIWMEFPEESLVYTNDLLPKILQELKIMNFQLSLITDTQITKIDVED